MCAVYFDMKMFESFREEKPLPPDKKDWFDPLKPKKKKPLSMTPQDAEQTFLRKTQELNELKAKNKKDAEALNNLTTEVQSVENKKLNATVKVSKLNNTKRNQDKMTTLKSQLNETRKKFETVKENDLKESQQKIKTIKEGRVTGEASTKIVKAINHVKLIPELEKEIKKEMLRNQELQNEMTALAKQKDEKTMELNKTLDLLNPKK